MGLQQDLEVCFALALDPEVVADEKHVGNQICLPTAFRLGFF